MAEDSLQSVVPQIKAILERIAQAKNNPQEIQKAVDEGKQQLDTLARNQDMSQQGQSQSQRR